MSLRTAISAQFIRFCLVGILNTMVDFIIYYLLTRSFWEFNEFITIPKAISYLAATVCSFSVNRYWTFEKHEPVVIKEVIRFYSTVGLGIFVNVGVQYFAVIILGFHDLVGVLLAAGGTALWGFLFSKFFVFVK